MNWRDWFAPRRDKIEAPQSLYELMHTLRVDMQLMRTEWEATQETVLTNLRKLSKRAARAVEADCGCKGGEPPADPVGGRMTIREARQKYGSMGGF